MDGDETLKAISRAIAQEIHRDNERTARSIAARVYDAQPDLMWAVQGEWMVDRLTRRVERERARELKESLRALDPDRPFRDLPRTIFLRDRTRPTLDWSCLKETEEHLALLRSARRKDPARIAQMATVVSIHRKWAESKPHLMWSEALEMETKSIVDSATKTQGMRSEGRKPGESDQMSNR